jgi:hypothetical protein
MRDRASRSVARAVGHRVDPVVVRRARRLLVSKVYWVTSVALPEAGRAGAAPVVRWVRVLRSVAQGCIFPRASGSGGIVTLCGSSGSAMHAGRRTAPESSGAAAETSYTKGPTLPCRVCGPLRFMVRRQPTTPRIATS